MADPAVAECNCRLGGGTAKYRRIKVELKPLRERKVTRIKSSRGCGRNFLLPGGDSLSPVLPGLRVGGAEGGAQYQYTLQSEDLKDSTVGAAGPGNDAADAAATGRFHRPAGRGLQATLVIDRDTASRLGISRNDR